METLTLENGYSRRKMRTRTVADFRPMSPDEAKKLHSGDHAPILARDGSAREVKINGAPKTWKRDPARVEVPAKYGMYEYATFVARDGRMMEWGGSGATLLVQVSEWREVAR